MYTAPVFFVIQQYNGDASGNLRGDVSVFTSQANAQGSIAVPSAPSFPASSSSSELCRFSVQTKTVVGEDPLVTINNALASKFPAGAYTLVA